MVIPLCSGRKSIRPHGIMVRVRASGLTANNGGKAAPFLCGGIRLMSDIVTTTTEETTFTDDGSITTTTTETEYPNDTGVEALIELEPIIEPEPVAPAPVIQIVNVETPNPEPVACAECAIKAGRIAELEAQLEAEEPIIETGGEPLPAPDSPATNDKPPNSRNQRKGIAAWYYGNN